MSNPEHVAILKKGAKEWNKFRKLMSIDQPDFSGEKLVKSDLKKANLKNASFRYCDLWRTDFSGADLRNADFNHASLINVVLLKANAAGADFADTDLRSVNMGFANLSNADLWNARFYRVNLEGAVFNGARVGMAAFVEVDLSTAVGLSCIEFFSASSVGLDTIYKSKGIIPPEFLRGCGVPEGFIEYMDALVRAEEMGNKFFSCFISYSHKDEAFAQTVHEFLKKNGVRVWLATHDLRIGEKIRDTLYSKIALHDKVFLILSKDSVKSDWVEEEVDKAFEEEKTRKSKVLFPIRIDDTVMKTNKAWAIKVRQRLVGDFTSPAKYAESFERLLRDLRTLKAPPTLGAP